MTASCSESNPSQNRTVLNHATTRSASAVKSGIWNLRFRTTRRGAVVRCRNTAEKCSNCYSGGGSQLQHNTPRAVRCLSTRKTVRSNRIQVEGGVAIGLATGTPGGPDPVACGAATRLYQDSVSSRDWQPGGFCGAIERIRIQSLPGNLGKVGTRFRSKRSCAHLVVAAARRWVLGESIHAGVPPSVAGRLVIRTLGVDRWQEAMCTACEPSRLRPRSLSRCLRSPLASGAKPVATGTAGRNAGPESLRCVRF